METPSPLHVLEGFWTLILVVLGAILIGTVVFPWIRSGHWLLRGWDFPRVQALFVGLITLSLVGITAFATAHGSPTLIVLALLSIFAIAVHTVAIWPFTPFWPVHVPSAGADDDSDTCTVLVANLRVENKRYQDVIAALRDSSPDLLVLIEINERWRNELDELAQDYPHRHDVIREEGLGLALWSRLNLSKAHTDHLVSERRPSIHTCCEHASLGSVRVIALHPTPPGLDDTTAEGRRNSRVRDAELMLVARRVAEMPDTPTLVLGDFNDVAWSYTTRLFRTVSGLGDPRIGRGLFNSYHAQYPLLRYPVDHVFVSKHFAIQSLRVRTIPGSDHFGMYTRLVMAGLSRKSKAGDHDGKPQSEAEKLISEGQRDAASRGIGSRPGE